MTSQYAFKSNVHKHIINWKAGAVFAIKWSNLITTLVNQILEKRLYRFVSLEAS